MECGEQCVVTRGKQWMQLLFADNSRILVQVSMKHITHKHIILDNFAELNGTVKLNAFFGPGVGPIFLDQVACNGNEESLLDCPSGGLEEVGSCTHSQDAGVVCGPPGKFY